MSYEMHNFAAGQTLYAVQLNEMDAQIRNLTNSVEGKLTEQEVRNIVQSYVNGLPVPPTTDEIEQIVQNYIDDADIGGSGGSVDEDYVKSLIDERLGGLELLLGGGF